ncbi:DUF3800 domain-containing protein [Lacisediminihabitans profunda]|uniref:DUF3800 domain-containing protein n=1 Tax=Lacisediminihabitans profunda TaxID=2594790 RepID=UPI001650BF05|nr:DUF3800 domain-containing protein [Lacisediminihabitans profunda]
MLYAFVDESERDDTHYFLGATVCTERQRDLLTREMDAVMEKHRQAFPSLTPDVEFHGSTMMRAQEEPWRSIPLRARIAIYRDALLAIEAVGTRVYVEGVDIHGQRARGYPNPTPARELAFSHLFERIDACCGQDEPQIQVVADEHHTSEVSRSNFAKYRNVGTYGYRSSYLPHIHQTIDFVQSHTVRALQAADLVTYLYNRRSTVTESDPRAVLARDSMWAAIDPAMVWPRGRARTWP